VVGGIPTVVFVVWYFSVEQPPKPSWTTPADEGLLSLASYVVRGLRDTLVAAGDVPGVLALAVLGVLAVWGVVRIVAIVVNRPDATRNAIALAGLLCAAGFFLISGFGRAETSAPRYVYVALGFAVPGLALALSQLAKRRWIELLAFLLVAALLIYNLQLLVSRSKDEAAREAIIKQSVIATAFLLSTGERVLEQIPEPVLSPQATTEVIGALLQAGAIPTGPVDDAAVARMRLALQVRIEEGTGTVTGGNPPTVVQQVDVSGSLGPGSAESPPGTGCLHPAATGPDPHLVIAAPDGLSTLQLSSATGGQFALTLESQPPDAWPRVITVQPGEVWSVDMDLTAGTELHLTVPPADAQLCGLG
jgi:hypothetical protein